MKEKLKMLRRIRAARERMRDVAAAELGIAEQERLAQDECRERSVELAVEIAREADVRMTNATSIGVLESFGDEIERSRAAIARATSELREAEQLSQKASVVLRFKEQQLRLTDKLVQDTRVTLSKKSAKQEQAMVDDIIASRFGKGSEQ